MKVYCNHHNEWGICSEEDYNDAKNGVNPSGMVRVVFNTFTHAVPIHTLIANIHTHDMSICKCSICSGQRANVDKYRQMGYVWDKGLTCSLAAVALVKGNNVAIFGLDGSFALTEKDKLMASAIHV